MTDAPRPTLRLPKALTFTRLACALVGVAACSGQTKPDASDASTDVTGYDAPPTDCDGGDVAYCGEGPCPAEGAYYCGLGCPPGCEPFA